jgi:diadenosine tetraphosphate (Ap4A) HIT family hydrolase
MEEFTSPMTRLKEDGVLISESEHFYAVTAEYSRVKGAIVILPKRQVSNYLELSVEESNDLMLHVRKLARATEKAYDPIGLSVWWETGTEADQFFDHLVVEITPYFEDIEYKYQPRSELTQTPLEHRQSWTQHIIKHLEP